MSPHKAATGAKPDVWPRLVADYILETRGAGVSARILKEVREDVLLPFRAEQGVTGSRELSTRHLTDLAHATSTARPPGPAAPTPG